VGDLGAITNALVQVPGKKLPNRPIGLRIGEKTLGVLFRETKKDPHMEIGIPFTRKTGPDITVFLNRDFLVKALRFGFSRLEVINSLTPMKFSGGRGMMIVMPVRCEAPKQIRPVGSVEKAISKETRSMPQRIKPKQPSESKVNQSRKRTNPPSEAESGKADPIDIAGHQLTEVKEGLKRALSNLNGLSASLKAIRQQRRDTEREIQTVRTTIRSLKKVDL